jgi:hypothetical protein
VGSHLTGSLLYLADRSQYQRSQSPDFEGFIRTSLEMDNAAWIFPSIALLEKYGNLRTRFHEAKLLENRDLILDGKKLPCFVIDGIMDSMDIDAVQANRKTQLWIDRDQYVIRREISTGTSTQNPAKGVTLNETIVFRDAKIHEAPAEELFSLNPPHGAAEVKRLFAAEVQRR